MVDFISTEIVEYVDIDSESLISISFNGHDYYYDKSTFWDNVGINQAVLSIPDIYGNSCEFHFSYVESLFEVTDVSGWLNYVNDTYSTSTRHYSVGQTLVVLYVEYVFNGYFYSFEDSLLTFGFSEPFSICNQLNITGTVYGVWNIPVPSQFIPDNYYPPVFIPGFSYGNDIFFLYDLGNLLVSSLIDISEFLNFGVGNITFFAVITFSGFLVYMGWCIVKWVIPL